MDTGRCARCKHREGAELRRLYERMTAIMKKIENGSSDEESDSDGGSTDGSVEANSEEESSEDD